jgi:hypothetical protein
MRSAGVTIATTAVLVVSADDKNRTVYLHNAGGGKVYLGGSAVISSNGFHLGNGEALELFIPTRETLYGISASGSNEVIVLTPDAD